MKKSLLLLLPFLILGAIAVSCGGGGKKTVKIGDTKVDVSGKIPSDFPSDFPSYKGAKVQGSLAGKSEGGITGTWVSWTTGDGADKVSEFYKNAFKDGPWKSTSEGSSGGTSFWMADSSDGKNTAYVVVSEAGGETTIAAVVGPKDSGSSSSSDSTSTSDSSSSAEDTPSSSDSSSSSEPTKSSEPLPDEVKLSDGFPKDRVPLPSGARVTSDSSFSSGGQKTSSIELYVKDKAENVSKFFETEAPKKGWENAFSSRSNGEYLLTFSASDSEGLTISISDSDTPGYAKVILTVSVKA